MCKRMRILGRAIILALLFCSASGLGAYAATEDEVPVFVGDTTLTYASYFFTIPAGWAAQAGENVTPLTNLTGFWSAQHKNGQASFRITPHKKNKDENIADFIKSAKQNILREPGCTLDSIQEYPAFKPDLKYPYQVAYFDNCPTGMWSIEVFADLPTHVVTFLLEVKGDGPECLEPYLNDFRQLLASFQWVLREHP